MLNEVKDTIKSIADDSYDTNGYLQDDVLFL